MPTESQKSETSQAVFSVCATPDVASATAAATQSISGAEFVGEFQEYISGEKRPQFPSIINNADSVVALIDCDRNPEAALETMDRLRQIFQQRVSLVAIGSRTETEFLLRAMRVGCDEFLSKPLDRPTFIAALNRFQRARVSASQVQPGKGRVLSFFGVKGGVGTTTLAVHLAMHLVKKHRKKVLLIDYKHELGHIALHLGIKESAYYFDELVRNVDRLDTDLLESFVTRHPSGLEVIPSPDVVAAPREVPADAIARIMDELRRRYDFVLIDTSMQYTSTTHAMMSSSDQVVLISTPDVAALRDLIRRVEHYALIDGFTDKLNVVINRSTSDDAVSQQDIEKTIHFPVYLAVPNNYAELMRAINAGEPVAPAQRGTFSNSFQTWAFRLTSDGSQSIQAPEPVKKRSFLFGF
ncbi:pilus assembly protein CpaE [Bryocella elongata]|uniref:Pilus assembly protein CpaE n=1 Tax=Bryocella elongata TaxID=863522 RepID=A0A1H6AWL1_9BACT|nr:AAA family ATPase [Bryocella elongata]SEG52782.1 pilus assembly protein CpaE [Bryocella elongata]